MKDTNTLAVLCSFPPLLSPTPLLPLLSCPKSQAHPSLDVHNYIPPWPPTSLSSSFSVQLSKDHVQRLAIRTPCNMHGLGNPLLAHRACPLTLLSVNLLTVGPSPPRAVSPTVQSLVRGAQRSHLRGCILKHTDTHQYKKGPGPQGRRVPSPLGTGTLSLGCQLPVPAAGFVSQVHPRIEETSHGKQLLDVEEVGVLEGLTENAVVEI